MAKSELLNGGELYDIMIDWRKRLENEIPFLESHFRKIKVEKSSILEVACGTGHHILELVKKGYNVIGLDIDPTMIAVANDRLKDFDIQLYVKDFLANEAQVPLCDHFDGVFCLGNAVGMMAQSSGYETIIKKFYDLLKTNGILIFQILNMEKDRNGWSRPTSHRTKHGEYIFIRGFKTTNKTINPEILTLFKNGGNPQWELLSVGSAEIPRITKNNLVKILEKNLFKNIQVFGSYLSEHFIQNSSMDMIFVCEKLK
ncbi:MAG: class I SAM-dependent methyltransferase [Candidatus Heimdallarchaeaceae archaeon]